LSPHPSFLPKNSDHGSFHFSLAETAPLTKQTGFLMPYYSGYGYALYGQRVDEEYAAMKTKKR
jgi:hypothetical protein